MCDFISGIIYVDSNVRSKFTIFNSRKIFPIVSKIWKVESVETK